MKLIRGIHNLSQAPHGCVLTIGNFDGVHRGHQALLQRLREEGRQRGLPVVVMIFEPQPLELFAADKAPARLTRLREKLGYLAESGVDYVLCVRFDRRFAALTAQDFISELLVRRLGVQFLAVGDDFRFGAGRQGDFLLLQKAGAEYGFDVTSTQTFCEGGVRISSTAVRQALADDDLLLAETLLGTMTPLSGTITLDGDDITRQSPAKTLKAGLGYVPEDRHRDGFVGEFSIAENLVLDNLDEYSKRGSLQLGLIARTARGRQLNAPGWKHLGLTPPSGAQDGLFDK